MLKYFMKAKKKKAGFTLIELIVVIAILAVLAIIITPRILGFVGNAKQSALESNARMLYNSVSLVVSQDFITLPGAGAILTWDALADDATGSMADCLDEWPTDPVVGGDVPPPLIVEIDENGAVEVEDSDGVHLVGATIADAE